MTDINNNPLPELPKMKRTRKPKPTVACECGCGGQTKSRFVPGHDARLHGWALRVERNVVTLEQVPEIHRAAVAKHLGRAVPTAESRVVEQPDGLAHDKKAARKAARAAAKAAKAQAQAETPEVEQPAA